MADKHLNLFYSYNRDNELIENNLTRAFIVFLSILSHNTRGRLIYTLIKEAQLRSYGLFQLDDIDFKDVHVALQSNIDRTTSITSTKKILLTVSTEPIEYSSITSFYETREPMKSEAEHVYSSIPDAWIFDRAQDFCILVEAKVGMYPLDLEQLECHAIDWFRCNLNALKMNNLLLSVTWIQILETLDYWICNPEFGNLESCESVLMRHMAEFIGYYGYQIFAGIRFQGLHSAPNYLIGSTDVLRIRPTFSGLENLHSAPTFRLASFS